MSTHAWWYFHAAGSFMIPPGQGDLERWLPAIALLQLVIASGAWGGRPAMGLEWHWDGLWTPLPKTMLFIPPLLLGIAMVVFGNPICKSCKAIASGCCSSAVSEVGGQEYLARSPRRYESDSEFASNLHGLLGDSAVVQRGTWRTDG